MFESRKPVFKLTESQGPRPMKPKAEKLHHNFEFVKMGAHMLNPVNEVK
jgi:hypothetical protein